MHAVQPHVRKHTQTDVRSSAHAHSDTHDARTRTACRLSSAMAGARVPPVLLAVLLGMLLACGQSQDQADHETVRANAEMQKARR